MAFIPQCPQSVPDTTVECRNNLSARSEPQVVVGAVLKEVASDYVIGPFATPPYETYRISPLGVAEGKYSHNKRLILDLSALHDIPDIDSINDLIDKEYCSLSYASINDANAEIVRVKVSAKMCEADIKGAFK